MRNKYRRVDLRVDWLELVRYVRCSRITSVSPNGTAFMDVTLRGWATGECFSRGVRVGCYAGICAPHLVMESVGEETRGATKTKSSLDGQTDDRQARAHGAIIDKQVSCDSDGDGTPIRWLSKNLTLAPLNMRKSPDTSTPCS